MTDKPTPAEITPADKQAAVKAYYDAITKEAKADVVKKFPFLKDIFSAVNHS
jgi:hypothetical protein